MGFTSVELMELQKDAEIEAGLTPDDDTSSEDAQKAADEAKAAEEAKKAEEAKAAEEAKKAEEEKKAAEGKGEKDDTSQKKEDDIDEARELRESNRKLQSKLDKVTAEYSRINKLLKDKGLIDAEDEKAGSEEEAAAKAAYEARIEKLNDITEVMRVNPKYENFDDVCSQKNFDDMFAAMARFYVAKQGGDLDETLVNIEKQVWSLPNPYKYMYEMITKYHPNYASKKDEGKTDEGKSKEGGAPEPKKAPPSLQDLPGGDGKGEQGGWTAERLDNLDEDEIIEFKAKHPDIYEKYLLGELK